MTNQRPVLRSCFLSRPIKGQYYLELVESSLAEDLGVLPVDDVVAGHQVHSEDSSGAEGPGHQPGPIRDEYSGHVTCIDQSEASIYLK